jgi:tryptophan-rich sensory protein
MRIASLILCILLCQAAGLLGARWTVSEIPTWYATLRKPSFQPPNWIFGPVWTTLYLLMAIAAWLITQSPASSLRTVAVALFSVQLVLNFLWTPIFFGRHAIRWGLADIVFLWLFVAATILVFSRIRASAAWLMSPYWAWVTFATVLNAAIVRLNPAS